MWTRHVTSIAAGALLVMVATHSIMAQQDQPQQMMQQGGGMGSQDMRSAMKRMYQDMSMPMSGDPDIDFARMMIPHHQGAIAMAKAELAQGKDPQLRQMAEDIINAQEKEIAGLKDWLATHPK